MARGSWTRMAWAFIGCGAVFILPIGPLKAQELEGPDLSTRIEQLERKNQELERRITDLEEPQKQEPSDKGSDAGGFWKMTARWDDSSSTPGPRLETANKDFTLHIGFRFQEDSVFFNQSPQLVPVSQVGELQDGTFFRRIRPTFDGLAWEVVEFKCELALEQVKQGIPTLDEVYAGLMRIPYVGTIRVGHMRVPQGFEGDQVSSSNAMTFLEKASYTDAFYENFAPGIWTGNSVLDQHLTWSAMLYRQELTLHDNNGADFGDGQYAVSGRLTFLPLYENAGRHLLHLGVSATWRKAEKPDPGLGGGPFVDFRARPEMRDAIGDFGNSPLPGNSRRWVDTGPMLAQSATVYGTELFYVLGPFSVQAEYAWAFANQAVVGGAPQGDLGFNGGYLELSYFLTGENRIYDRRLGRMPAYIARPNTNFWVTRAEDGSWSWGRGAWEIAARYSYLDLNDGPVRGGIMNGLAAGVNWYLNNNLKVQFEYLYNSRSNLQPGQLPGHLNALGTRVTLLF